MTLLEDLKALEDEMMEEATALTDMAARKDVPEAVATSCKEQAAGILQWRSIVHRASEAVAGRGRAFRHVRELLDSKVHELRGKDIPPDVLLDEVAARVAFALPLKEK